MRDIVVFPADNPPRLHQSLAKVLVQQSPRHALQAYIDRREGTGKPTAAQTQGSILDAMVFGIGMDEFVVVECNEYRSNADKDIRDSVLAMGKTPVKRKEYEKHVDTVKAIHEELALHGIVLGGKSQVTLKWDSLTSDGEKVACEGKLDHLILTDYSAVIYDLKTLTNAHPDIIAKKMAQFGSHVQRSAYVEAVEANYPHLAGRVEMVFVYAETGSPWDVHPCEPAGSMKMLGDFEWRKGVNLWAKCLKTGQWPGYCKYGAVSRIEAKPWDLARAEMEPEGAQNG